MLTLDLPTDPCWIDLPRGVRVEIKPATTAVMAAAQAAASRRLGAARAEAPEGGIDADMAEGLAFAFLVKALARHAVVAWEGVGDRAGTPLDPTPDNVERLMDLGDAAAGFWDRAGRGGGRRGRPHDGHGRGAGDGRHARRAGWPAAELLLAVRTGMAAGAGEKPSHG